MNITLRLKIEKMKRESAKAHQSPQGLIEAARDGDLTVVKNLISQNPFYLKKTLTNALYSAAAAGKLEVVKYLVENGADINQELPEYYFNTTLKQAICAKHLEVVEYLLQQGADVNHKNSHTRDCGLDDVLFNARYYPLKYIKSVLNLLIEHGADLSINRTSPQEKFEQAADGIRSKSQYLTDADERIAVLKDLLLAPEVVNDNATNQANSSLDVSRFNDELPTMNRYQPIVHLLLKDSPIQSNIRAKTQIENKLINEEKNTEVLTTSTRQVM